MSFRTGLTAVEVEVLPPSPGIGTRSAPMVQLIPTWDAGDGTGLAGLTDLLPSAP